MKKIYINNRTNLEGRVILLTPKYVTKIVGVTKLGLAYVYKFACAIPVCNTNKDFLTRCINANNN